MMMMNLIKQTPLAFALIALLLNACKRDDSPVKGEFYTVAVSAGGKIFDLQNAALNQQIEPGQALRIQFNLPVDQNTLNGQIQLLNNQALETPLVFSMESELVVLATASTLEHLQDYTLKIPESVKSVDGRNCTAIQIGFSTKAGLLKVDSIVTDGINLKSNPPAQNINRNFSTKIHFNHPLDPSTVNAANIKLFKTNEFANIQWSLEQQDSTLVVTATEPLKHLEEYQIFLTTGLRGTQGYRMAEFKQSFYTAVDPTPKFPLISDEALMDLVQEKTFRYFWDFGHPVSGMARERNTSGETVTTGGTGFGLMAIIVGVERGFITREAGVERWQKIVNFLKNNAQRYHGAWSHWLNGSTGITIPFSTRDNGADLVETSFLVEGLLTVRQYLNTADPEELQLYNDIQYLWETVEWDWFTRGGQNVLYWHWSPNYNWDMNLQIRGYNECLITYFLAASSPTHPISAAVYHQGWASSGQHVNNNTYFGYTLPLGYAYGGPLFFAHYSYLGLDPRNLTDTYAEYWTQNRNHTLINRAYCIANPLQKVGYSEECWGLTASDNHNGYSAHSPTNDLGVITPTAALSSFPYTPDESMAALKYFYYQIGDKTWGEYGFYDAFNITEGWFGKSYLAIDQGPIVVMMENHRTGKLWNLFMSAPEVAVGANKLGFTY